MNIILAENDKRHLGCPICNNLEKNEGDVFTACEKHYKLELYGMTAIIENGILTMEDGTKFV